MTRHPDSTPRQAGFTLIEMMVAITLMGMVLGLVGAAFRTIAGGWDRSTARMLEQDMFLRARSLLQRDIEGLQRFYWPDGKSERYIFEGRARSLRLVSVEPPYPGDPGLYFLHYGIAAGASASLVRSRDRYHPDVETFSRLRAGDSVPVVEGAFRYRFSYAEDISGKWQWRARWPHDDKLPDLIRLEVLDAASGRAATPAIIVRPRLDAEQACVSAPKFCSLKRPESAKKEAGNDKS